QKQKVWAHRSRLEALPDGDDWLLQKVSVTTINDSQIHSEYIESVYWKDFLRRNSTGEPESVATDNSTELVSADVLKSISVDPESLSASSLYEQIRYLENNQLDSRRIELAFWIKIVSPISTIVMLMLSLPFVFSSQRSGGAGQKIFIGIMLGIIYVLLNRLLTQLAMTNGLSPALSAALPLLCFFAVAVVGIRRIN
ncbi:MAG: LptF/LptG family permease, partial [Granulosicoccus sp.]